MTQRHMRTEHVEAKRKGKVGRPATLTMPEPIPDTPENVAKAMMRTPPRKRDEWKFVHGSKNASPAAGVET